MLHGSHAFCEVLCSSLYVEWRWEWRRFRSESGDGRIDRFRFRLWNEPNGRGYAQCTQFRYGRHGRRVGGHHARAVDGDVFDRWKHRRVHTYGAADVGDFYLVPD